MAAHHFPSPDPGGRVGRGTIMTATTAVQTATPLDRGVPKNDSGGGFMPKGRKGS